jgi:uncharacterized Zn finger protein
MERNEPDQKAQPRVRSNCPDCNARLTVLRIIPGRANSEYWALRCTRCGGVHLDVVKLALVAPF